jgi:ABC-type lipoprotein release transport system permease subunit
VNPLSPLTYYRRHRRNALLLMGLVTLATLGLYVMVAVLDSQTLMHAHTNYLARVSQVYPSIEPFFEPGVLSQIRMHPDVERVIPEKGLDITVPLLGGSSDLHVLGVSRDDMEYLMDHCGVRLKEGRLVEPHTNEIMLPEETARALDLELGARIDRSINDEFYWEIETPLVLVGILEGDPSILHRAGLGALSASPSVRVGFASYEYLDSHELYAPGVVSQIVVAREGRRAAVEEFLENTISSKRTEVRTFGKLYRLQAADRRGILVGYGIVNGLVAAAAAVIVGVINHIALTRRVSELGLLNAIGYPRGRLIRRLSLEAVAMSGISWGAGLALALLVLIGLKSTVYYDRGMDLYLTNLTPLWVTTPIPLTVAIFAVVGIGRMFSEFDAIAILERGKLSPEGKLTGRWRAVGESSVKPFSSLTFYLRHPRRGMVLVLGTALMILVITLPMFVASAITDAMMPNIEHLRAVSEVSSTGEPAVEAAVVGQLKSHPMVERIVPVIPLALQVPVPLGRATQTHVFGVPEDDLPTLIDLFELHVKQGRLPRARSNEIVLSESIALNRGLQIGDTVELPLFELGAADQMILYGAPVEMIISGILSPGDLWLGFASYEYLKNHESVSSEPVRLFVVPTNEHKDELDGWLEESVSSWQTEVATYRARYSEMQQELTETALVFALTEVGIMIVVAVAVATMNTIFFAQRREEFGVLYAVGHGRRWLVSRTMREAGSTVAVAWALSVVVYVIIIACAQIIVYSPRGLSLNLLNPIPWLFTLPIPLTVVAASGGTVGRLLARLDPVTVIEGQAHH